MIRFTLLILPVLAIAGGCSPTERYIPPVTMVSQHLLFDRVPGWPTANEIVRAGDWPATRSFQPEAEVAYYRETVHDVQGFWPHQEDFTYRRFQYRREGVGTR